MEAVQLAERKTADGALSMDTGVRRQDEGGGRYTLFVIPAEAGIKTREACGFIRGRSPIRIPAFAGMTVRVAVSGVCLGVSPKPGVRRASGPAFGKRSALICDKGGCRTGGVNWKLPPFARRRRVGPDKQTPGPFPIRAPA